MRNQYRVENPESKFHSISNQLSRIKASWQYLAHNKQKFKSTCEQKRENGSS